MLHISEAYELFERLAKPDRMVSDNPDNLKLQGIILSNGIDKSFGRTYFRTKIKFVGNFWIMHEKTYVSYRISDWRSGQELIDECRAVQEEQFEDVLELKTKIKELFPDISVQITMMGYEFLMWCDDRTEHDDNLILTGSPVLEIIEPMNSETEKGLEATREYQTYWKDDYLERKERIRTRKQEREQEKNERLERLSKAMDEHRANENKNFAPIKKRLSRIEQRALEFKK